MPGGTGVLRNPHRTPEPSTRVSVVGALITHPSAVAPSAQLPLLESLLVSVSITGCEGGEFVAPDRVPFAPTTRTIRIRSSAKFPNPSPLVTLRLARPCGQ